MFYKTEIEDHIRVPPEQLAKEEKVAVHEEIKKKYTGYISKELGIVIDVVDVKSIGEGIIIPGDGAAYFRVNFEILTFKPVLHEIIMGKIRDIADFGAFMSIGPIEGMIHISQTMSDYVSFAKDKILTGRETNRTLKIDDQCKARIVAVSFKEVANPRISLTMRQPGLGKQEWINEEIAKKDAEAKAK